jgi:hypothetical protein
MSYNNDSLESDSLEVLYPELYTTIKNLYKFEEKFNNYITKKCGKDTIDSLIIYTEYNRQKLIQDDTFCGKSARMHNMYYNQYIIEKNKIIDLLGYTNGNLITDIIEKAFKKEKQTDFLDTTF